MEEELDRIAGGEAAWKSVLGGFWGAFSAALEETGGRDRATVLAAVEERLAGYIYGTGGEPARRRCPACGGGVLRVKASRHGPFVGCGAWPACGYRRPLASGSDAAARAGPKRLGTDPAFGLAVTLRRGPHGHYIQLGGAGAAKPRRMSVPGGMDPDGIGLEAALKLLALPREVGAHPASGQPILAGIDRYSPWVRYGATYAAILGRFTSGLRARRGGAAGWGKRPPDAPERTSSRLRKEPLQAGLDGSLATETCCHADLIRSPNSLVSAPGTSCVAPMPCPQAGHCNALLAEERPISPQPSPAPGRSPTTCPAPQSSWRATTAVPCTRRGRRDGQGVSRRDLDRVSRERRR